MFNSHLRERVVCLELVTGESSGILQLQTRVDVLICCKKGRRIAQELSMPAYRFGGQEGSVP